MRLALFLALTSALLTGGCGVGAEAAGKRIVAEMLKDPGSAQFRNVKTYASVKDQAAGRDSVRNRVCGEVNGKNSFGAFSGFQRFYVDLDTKTAHLAPEPSSHASPAEQQAEGYAGVVFDVEYSAGCS